MVTTRVISGIAGIAASVALAAPASGDGLDDVERDVRRLHRSLGTLSDVAYALRDPGQLRVVAAALYGTLLQDPVTRALIQNIAGQYRGGAVQLALDAGATADLTTPGAVTASAEAAWDLPLCRVLGASASGLGGYADGELLGSWSLGATACLPLPANTIQVSYTRRDNVRTTLLDRPIVLTDRRSDDVIDVMIRFYRWLGSHNQIDVIPLEINVGVQRSAEGVALGAVSALVEAAPVVWHRRGRGLAGADQSYRFFQFRGWFHADDQTTSGLDAAVGNVSPLIIDGIHIADSATVGVDLGWSVSSVYAGDTQLLVRTDLHAEAWLAAARPPLATEFRASHGLMPTFGGQLVLEDRLAGRIEVVTPHYAARANGFFGRASVIRPPAAGPRETALVGGLGADVAWALVRRVHLIGRLELARAFAPAAGGADPELQLDVRATIGVTAHYDRRW